MNLYGSNLRCSGVNCILGFAEQPVSGIAAQLCARESRYGQHISGWLGLGSSKTLFAKTGFGWIGPQAAVRMLLAQTNPPQCRVFMVFPTCSSPMSVLEPPADVHGDLRCTLDLIPLPLQMSTASITLQIKPQILHIMAPTRSLAELSSLILCQAPPLHPVQASPGL